METKPIRAKGKWLRIQYIISPHFTIINGKVKVSTLASYERFISEFNNAKGLRKTYATRMIMVDKIH